MRGSINAASKVFTMRLGVLGILAAVAALCGCDGRRPLGPEGAGEPQQQSAAGREGTAGGPSPFAFDLTTPAKTAVGSSADARPATCTPFDDVAAATGLEHVYDNGEDGKSLMAEATGGGAGWLDYDRDGRPDLHLGQGGDPSAADRAAQPSDRLFRNLPGSDGGAVFVDVTELAQLRETGYSQGVAIGDYDDDGFDDIYVTNAGTNTLFRNLGYGTFRDVTKESRTGDARWSSSAAWADLDGDHDLDLYVCNYLQYDILDPLPCNNPQGEPRICHPRDIDPWPDACFLNNGDGTFRDAASEMGLFGPGNKGLGVAVADFTADGLVDLYVANDTEANFLFVNQGGGRFEERAMVLGCAVDRLGRTQASMGLAVGDYDNDGSLDIYSAHFYDESNTLYRGLGTAGFEDVTGLVGLHTPTLPRLGFGTIFCDFDADGLMDLFIANGHIENFPGNPLLAQQPQLLEWTGSTWHDCSSMSGPFFEIRQVARGVAAADYDGDGDVDLAVVHQNTPVALLENRAELGRWLGLEFVGTTSNRRGIGCKAVVRCGEQTITQQLIAGSSYASSHQPRLFVGLGPDADNAATACQVEITWPSGIVQTLDNVALGQTLTVTEPAN